VCIVNWEPGTLIADDDGNVFFIVARPGMSAVDADGNGWRVASIEGAHPLVVLDPELIRPERRGNLESLASWLRIAGDKADAHDTSCTGFNRPVGHGDILRRIADQIEAQTKPPKPEEPLGQYAVVRDRNDSLWVRLNQTHWYSEASPNNNQTYGEIDAVEVVREGVAP